MSNIQDPNSVLFIVGPTASGKSGLAIQIAHDIEKDGQKALIISADSRQIYIDLDIITAKEQARPKPYLSQNLLLEPFNIQNVPHFLIDIIEPTQSFTLFDFQELAQSIIDKYIGKYKIIIAGGTGLYVDSLINNYKIPQNQTIDSKVRDSIESDYQKLLIDYSKEEANILMHKKLQTFDLERSQKIDPQNIYSVLRELEVIAQTGKTKDKISNKAKPEFNYDIIYICPDRQKLYDRINKRVVQMFEIGLEQEAKQVLNTYDSNLPSISSIGYPEFLKFKNNQISKEELISSIQQNTRKYAKRQFTWFNRYLEDPKCIQVPDPKKFSLQSL